MEILKWFIRQDLMLVYFYENKPIDQYNFKRKCGKIRGQDTKKGYQNIITHTK